MHYRAIDRENKKFGNVMNQKIAIETGVIKKPSVFVVSKIAKALDISIENLLK